jgi:hypothetical protein
MIIVLVVAVPDNATISVLTRVGACRQPARSKPPRLRRIT